MGEDRMKYSVGFLFNPDETKVVLIKKNRPDWEKGLLNGVGGHIEVNEAPEEAMSREFKEETGVSIPSINWSLFAILTTKHNHKVWFFHVTSNRFYNVRTVTDEKIVKVNLDNLYEKPMVYNLKWLIPLALDDDMPKPLILEHKNLKRMK